MIRKPSPFTRNIGWRALCCLVLLTATAFAASLPSVGDAAPDFELLSQSGSKVSLKSYKGQWVILLFAGDHTGKNVGLLIHNLERDAAKFSSANAAIIGIARTTYESNQAWAEQAGISFPILSDPDGITAKLYGASDSSDGFVYEVVIAPDGKVQLPRITTSDFDGESDHLLACLQYFRQHLKPAQPR